MMFFRLYNSAPLQLTAKALLFIFASCFLVAIPHPSQAAPNPELTFFTQQASEFENQAVQVATATHGVIRQRTKYSLVGGLCGAALTGLVLFSTGHSAKAIKEGAAAGFIFGSAVGFTTERFTRRSLATATVTTEKSQLLSYATSLRYLSKMDSLLELASHLDFWRKSTPEGEFLRPIISVLARYYGLPSELPVHYAIIAEKMRTDPALRLWNKKIFNQMDLIDQWRHVFEDLDRQASLLAYSASQGRTTDETKLDGIGLIQVTFTDQFLERRKIAN